MERIIQQTDYDALSSKLCALEKNYLPPATDSLIKFDNNQLQKLYENTVPLYLEYLHTIKDESRNIYGKISKLIKNPFPVMNYGTYLRTMAIDLSILNFINSLPNDTSFQIINLGCGSDLRSIQYLTHFKNLINFVDLDFNDAIALKAKILTKSENLNNIYLNFKQRYNLLSGDLKNSNDILNSLNNILDKSIPTILITECVLCYMKDNDSQNLINGIMKNFTNGCWISYDPIGGSNPNDKFGIIMKRNLMESRHLDMPTLLIYNSKENYPKRWENTNLENLEIKIMDMWVFLSESISHNEKKRIGALQFLDEIEELKIMQSHYVILNAKWNL